MKPKKKTRKKTLTDLERLAPPPSLLPPEQPNRTCLALKVTFDNGEQQRYAINAVLRQELLTRLTPSLDKPVQSFISFIEPDTSRTILLNTTKIISVEIVRS